MGRGCGGGTGEGGMGFPGGAGTGAGGIGVGSVGPPSEGSAAPSSMQSTAAAAHEKRPSGLPGRRRSPMARSQFIVNGFRQLARLISR